jgi:hypothetical protein
MLRDQMFFVCDSVVVGYCTVCVSYLGTRTARGQVGYEKSASPGLRLGLRLNISTCLRYIDPR